jgi:hypothetical protein
MAKKKKITSKLPRMPVPKPGGAMKVKTKQDWRGRKHKRLDNEVDNP